MVTTDKNLAAVLYAPRDLRMEERPVQEPGPNEVQINVRATGICGSDLHYFIDGRIGARELDPNNPMVLGHESSGVVTAVGPGVQRLRAGDRVAIEPGKACRSCDRCNEGKYNLCPTMKFSASLLNGPNDGTLRRYVCFPEHLCHPLPDTMSYEDGALMEPLSVAVHAVTRTFDALPNEARTVAVLGAGPIGLLVAATAYAKGAKECILFDINESRLAFAKTYLPQVHTMQLPLAPKGQDSLDWARAQLPQILQAQNAGDGYDAVFECTGQDTCIGLSLLLARRGGVTQLIGLGKGRAPMPTDAIVTREVTVLGNFRYANAYPTAIELVQSGALSLEGLVTNRFKLEDTLQAFETAMRGDVGVIKIQIGDF